MTPWLLAWWLKTHIGDGFAVDGDGDLDTLEDQVRMEINIADAHDGAVGATGAMEMEALGEDPGEAAVKQAQTLVYGWPSVEQEATLPRNVGRFPKSFPLDFPMGIADFWGARPRAVKSSEWVQHMLRLADGRCAQGLRGHRVVWAMVNTALIEEASGKGFAVHRNVMRRLGWRVVGGEVLTKAELREMMESEETCRALVHQLMSVGVMSG